MQIKTLNKDSKAKVDVVYETKPRKGQESQRKGRGSEKTRARNAKYGEHATSSRGKQQHNKLCGYCG